MTPRLTPQEARDKRYKLDTSVYPHLAYCGPRMRPTRTRPVFTDTEAEMLVAIREILYQGTRKAVGEDQLDFYLIANRDLMYQVDRWTGRPPGTCRDELLARCQA